MLIWHTPFGYEMRTIGHNPEAAVYAGIRPAPHHHDRDVHLRRAGRHVGVNELMGVQHRIVLDFPAGYGFVGIAVALMGRNHPVGIVLAAMLFGALPGRRRARLRDARASPAT